MTTDDPSGKPEVLPEPLLEAAAGWHARMREPEGDPVAAAARQATFARWLAADPRHVLAFQETERLWAKLGAPVAEIIEARPTAVSPAATGRRRRPRFTTRTAWATACLALIVAIGATQYDDVLIRLQSDYRTAVGERAPLTLDDGSRLTLNTDSAVALDMGPDRRQVRLLQGEAWFDVEPHAARPFSVITEAGRVRVTGTSFGVRLQGDAATVALAEGQIELLAETGAGAGASLLVLTAGQQARLSQDGVSDPAVVDETTATAWLRGQIVFFDTPLRDVVAELNRYRAGRIVIANDALDGLTVSGVFSTGDPDAALGVIADTLPVRITRLTDFLVLLR